MNDFNAYKELGLQFNVNNSTLIEFARRTKTFLLRKLFSVLINNYCDRYFDVVSYANEHFNVSFEPDCKGHELIDPI